MPRTRSISFSSFGSSITEMAYANDTAKGYRYGFNGEELENDIGGDGIAYDLGARFYDGRLGRMFSVDPLIAEYPWQSPYAYCNNSPICSIDIKGMGDDPVPANNDIRRKDGKLEIFDANVTIKNPDGTETKGAWIQPSANLAAYITGKYAKNCIDGKDDGKDFSSAITAMADYTVNLYSAGNKYSKETIMKSASFSQEILLSNGILVDFNYISEDAAKQLPNGENRDDKMLYYDFTDFGNDYMPAPHGNTQMYSGGSQVIDFSRDASVGSYVNLFRIKSEAKTYNLNVDFLSGYILSHEILHGLIIRTTNFYKWTQNTPINMGVDSDGHSAGQSLNQSGRYMNYNNFKKYQFVPQYNFKIPLPAGYYPFNPYTTIKSIQLNYIKNYLR